MQIQIAQSQSDEKSMTDWLHRQGRFLCAPKIFSGDFEAVPLGSCDDLRQIVFLAEFQSVIEESISNVLGRDGRHVSPVAGGDYFFSWSRTDRREPNEIRVGGEFLSRVHYKSRGINQHAEAQMTRLMKRLISFLKRSSSMKSTSRVPIYVGEDLAKQINAGQTVVLYPNGERIPLVVNS